MQKCIVNIPVTDLRREPTSLPKFSGKNDLLQESQLLFGEQVDVKEEKNGWSFVAALEQMKNFPDGSWQGYPGWIQSHHLSSVQDFPNNNYIVQDRWAPLYGEPDQSPPLMFLSLGTQLNCKKTNSANWLEVIFPTGMGGYIATSSVLSKESIIANANGLNVVSLGRKFVGMPYLWGGRSAYDANSPMQTSVDCSGLAHLIYTLNGINLPRDAHDQFLRSTECQGKEVSIGDLIFSASAQRPEKIMHVMIYAGNDVLLEATQSIGCVRFVSAKELWGKPLYDIQYGATISEICLYLGKIV